QSSRSGQKLRAARCRLRTCCHAMPVQPIPCFYGLMGDPGFARPKQKEDTGAHSAKTRTMTQSRHARYLLRTAMLLTVLVVVGHIHSHLCLDGQEPALSVHFEAFNGHPDHADDHYADAEHVDVENELVPQGLLASKAPVDEA